MLVSVWETDYYIILPGSVYGPFLDSRGGLLKEQSRALADAYQKCGNRSEEGYFNCVYPESNLVCDFSFDSCHLMKHSSFVLL